MQFSILKKIKVFSVVFLVISALGVFSTAQANFKSYRSGHSFKGSSFKHSGFRNSGFRNSGFRNNSFRHGGFGFKGGFKSNYKYKGAKVFGHNSSFNRFRNSSSYGRNYSYNHRYNSYNKGLSYRNFAFRSNKSHLNKGFSGLKSGSTVIIAGAASTAAASQNGEPNSQQTANKDQTLTCYNYRLTSAGGIGGFRFNDGGDGIKVANNSSINGEFCGKKFVEFELAKVDQGVNIDFEINGNVFKFPANAESVQEGGWNKKFFSVDLK